MTDHDLLAPVFAALSDATRFGIVERLLREGEQSVGDIARDLPVTPPAVTHHLKVLERAGVITRRAHRQQRFVSVRPETFEHIDDWLTRHRAFWSGALDRLDEEIRSQAKDRKQ